MLLVLWCLIIPTLSPGDSLNCCIFFFFDSVISDPHPSGAEAGSHMLVPLPRWAALGCGL